MKFEPVLMLRTLVGYQVDFIVIGGIAAASRGSPVATIDLDVCYSRDPRNLQKLSAALREMHAQLRGVDEDVPFILDAKMLAAGDSFTLTTELGDLDILGTPAGTDGFRDLATGAGQVEVEGVAVKVASVEDLIRMKRAAGRTKDVPHIALLEALMDRSGQTDDQDSEGER